jgi:hypothetical protein
MRSALSTLLMYVSLYGLTSVRQIEDEFQRQLHPNTLVKENEIWMAKGLSIETGQDSSYDSAKVEISVGVSILASVTVIGNALA